MVQIWNDGSLPVQTYRLSSSGEEIKHASPISKGAAILAEGCSKTFGERDWTRAGSSTSSRKGRLPHL